MLGLNKTICVLTAAVVLWAFLFPIPTVAEDRHEDEIFLSGITGLRAEVQVIGADVVDRRSLEAAILKLLRTSGVPLAQSRDQWLKSPGQPLLSTKLIFAATGGTCAFHLRMELTESARSLRGTQGSDTRALRARTGLWALWGWTTDYKRCAKLARQGAMTKAREFVEHFLRANPDTLRTDGSNPTLASDLALAGDATADPKYVSALLERGVLLHIYGLADDELDAVAIRQSIIHTLRAAGVGALDESNTPEDAPILTFSAGIATFGKPRSHCVIAPVTELREPAVLTRNGRDAQIAAWTSPPFVTSVVDDASLQENCRKMAFEKLGAQLRGLIAFQRTHTNQ